MSICCFYDHDRYNIIVADRTLILPLALHDLDYNASSDCIFTHIMGSSETVHIAMYGITVVTDSM